MKRFLRILIIVTLLISTLGFSTFAAELSDLQEQQTQVQANQDMATSQLQAVQEELTENLQQIQELNTNITQYETEINEYNTQIVTLQDDITKTEEEIKKAEDNYNSQKKLLDDRLVTMYQAGTTEYLDVVLSSKTITEFLSNYYLLSILADSNVDFLDTIEQQKQIIEDEKKKLEEQKKQIDTAKEEKEKASIILQNTKVMKDTYTSQLTDQEKQIQSEIDAYQAQLNQLEAEIQSINN